MVNFARVSVVTLIFSLVCLNIAHANEIIKEKREVAGFTKVVISGAGHLILKQGSTDALTIEADQNLLTELKSEVRDNTLYLGPKDTVHRSDHEIKYHLTVKNIEDIRSEGGIEITSNGSLAADALNLSTEGAGKVNLKIKTEKLNIKVEGSGDLTLAGTATVQILTIEGAGKIQGKKLTTKTTQVNIAGAGIAEVNASEILNVKIEGVGTVKYSGTPKVTQEISGAGEIIPLD